MALSLFNPEEEEENRGVISAGQASLPMYGSMQAQGAGALGDILGIDTGAIDEFGRRQEGILSQFQPKHPER